YLQRGFFTVLALPMSSLITVLSIAISLFLLAGFLLILQNVDHFLSEAGTTLNLTAYLKDGSTQDKIADLIRELEGNSRVRAVHYVSKEEALSVFKKDLGERSNVLQGLDEKNPLPASIDVVLRQEDLGIDNLERLVSQLRANPLIDEVVYGSEWVQH